MCYTGTPSITAVRHHQLFGNLVQISVTMIRYIKLWWGPILLALPTDCYIKEDVHCDHQPIILLLFKVFCSHASLQLRLLLLWEQPQCPSVSQSCVMSRCVKVISEVWQQWCLEISPWDEKQTGSRNERWPSVAGDSHGCRGKLEAAWDWKARDSEFQNAVQDVWKLKGRPSGPNSSYKHWLYRRALSSELKWKRLVIVLGNCCYQSRVMK